MQEEFRIRQVNQDLKALISELQSATKLITLQQEDLAFDEHKLIESIMKLMVKDLQSQDQYKLYYAF